MSTSRVQSWAVHGHDDSSQGTTMDDSQNVGIDN
jgi:hypothetical protein